MTEPNDADRPVLQVVAGRPSAAEVAALTAVISVAASGAGGAERPAATVGWADPAAGLRRPLTPGPGAWRASARRY